MLLTDEERQQFATLVNAVIDLPLVSEELEQTIFEHAIAMIDGALEETLPVIFHSLMRQLEQGIDKDHAKDFTNRLVQSVNRQIDLPYLNEEQEEQLLRIVITPLVKAMTNGKTLQTVLPALRPVGGG